MRRSASVGEGKGGDGSLVTLFGIPRLSEVHQPGGGVHCEGGAMHRHERKLAKPAVCAKRDDSRQFWLSVSVAVDMAVIPVVNQDS